MERTMERAGNFLPRVDARALEPSEVDRRVVTLTAPASMAAEQYRTLYYRLERMREMRAMKVIAFTSARAGEGKTITAVNLALTAARASPERRVLLIDADLRRGKVGEVLGVGPRPGLAELLQSECALEDAVRHFQATPLMLVPAGAAAEEPTRLLASARMKALLRRAREDFDEIYVDLPPALPFADPAILGGQADGMVVVIRAGATSLRQVDQAIEHLAGVPLVGCVLNGAEPGAAPCLDGQTC